jgi:two-component system chemotaxis sensor kinase CheA
VKSVFQRMARLVREMEAQTGKSVRLLTEGQDTEVDKTIIERLIDPITHMVRNAIDHGIELPHKRLARGKPETGLLRLSAAHRAGRVFIEVADDGAGIDRARVRAIAEARGLASPELDLSDDEIDNLIFAPGFSTASEISEVSGRGVGMDVVKRSVEALGGRIVVSSRAGQGALFTLSLPLTLAILDGMVVSAGGQTLIAPATALVETLQASPGDIVQLGADARMLNLRGVVVPLLNLADELGYQSPQPSASALALLVEDKTGARAALLVDEILGLRQVVIKSLDANYGEVFGVAAATILGDGRVALILDVDALLASLRNGAAYAAAA